MTVDRLRAQPSGRPYGRLVTIGILSRRMFNRYGGPDHVRDRAQSSWRSFLIQVLVVALVAAVVIVFVWLSG